MHLCVATALQIWDTTKKCTQYSGITVIEFTVFNCELESTLLHCTMYGKILVHVTVKKL
jgi:hypothetical protein